MPVSLPSRSPRAPRLSLFDSALFLILVARARLLDLRLAALYRRAERRGCDPHGPTLLRFVRRWLAIHDQIGALLPGIPEPSHVHEVRMILERTFTHRGGPPGGCAPG